MRNFLGGFFRGIIVNLFGIVIVYIIVFCFMAPKLPKDLKTMKVFVSDMVNVKGNILKMQNKSSDILSKPEMKLAVESDSMTPEEMAKAIAATEVSPAELFMMKKDMMRLQKQLDRIENQNRALSLRLSQQEKLQSPPSVPTSTQ